jgi:hypothetical protein
MENGEDVTLVHLVMLPIFENISKCFFNFHLKMFFEKNEFLKILAFTFRIILC